MVKSGDVSALVKTERPFQSIVQQYFLKLNVLLKEIIS